MKSPLAQVFTRVYAKIHTSTLRTFLLLSSSCIYKFLRMVGTSKYLRQQSVVIIEGRIWKVDRAQVTINLVVSIPNLLTQNPPEPMN